MGKILKLPPYIANRIAAGEVVERPASIVKELIENAVDAGASAIEIVLEDGGKTSISVRDNGCGMTLDEILVAVERHTTSKITTASDLERITTLGFRGEALPSIGSVARIRIESRPKNAENGAFVEVEDGIILNSGEIGLPKGTAVSVSRLFFSVPARRKFLKSDRTEFEQSISVIRRLGLASISVRFTLSNNGKPLYDLPPAELFIDRIKALFGKALVSELIPIEAQRESVSLFGFVGKPGTSRTRGDMQYTILNGRPVHSPLIATAVRQALKNALPHGKYPVFFIHIEIDPTFVDVNVHPSKYEVRLRRKDMVFKTVYHAVAAHFATGASIPDRTERIRLLPSLTPSVKAMPLFGRRETSPPMAHSAENIADEFILSRDAEAGADDWNRGSRLLAGGDESQPAFFQVHRTYIIAETRGAVIIVDQHAAHERILYEEVLRRMKRGGVPSQPLLFPMEMTLTAEQVGVARRFTDELHSVGFDFALTDAPPTATLLGIPSFVKDAGNGSAFVELLSELAEGLTSPAENILHKFAASVACHSAIKAGDTLAPDEMKLLFDRLFTTERPYTCPHGRPTVIKLTLRELEQRFGRIE